MWTWSEICPAFVCILYISLLKGTCKKIIAVCSSTEAILNVHFCGEGTCDLPPLGCWMFQEHLVTIVFTGIHPLSISTLEGSLWFQGKGTFQHGAAKLIAKVVGTELLPCWAVVSTSWQEEINKSRCVSACSEMLASLMVSRCSVAPRQPWRLFFFPSNAI